jgi:predicted RND superfamily exporter protein
VFDPLTFSVVAATGLSAGLALAWSRPDLIVGYPRTVLAVLALFTLGALLSLIRLVPFGVWIEVDPSSEPLLPVSDPGQEVYRKAILDFGSDDIYVVAMETDDVFTRTNLQVLRRITDGIRKLPGVRGAESLIDVHAFRYEPEEDWIEISKLIRTIPSDPAELEDLRRRALEDPIYPKTIVSTDGRTAAINVTFKAMTDREFMALDLDGRIQDLIEQERTDERRFYIAGRPHVRTAAHHLMIRDMVRLIPLAVAVAATVLWLMTGSLRGTLIPLVSCLTATLWSFGGMGAVGRDLNVITLVLGPMLICVGSVYGVHVIARYETITLEAHDGRTAAQRCLEYTRMPVLIAGFTTCVGFGALLLSDIRATNELGAFSVFGVAAVTLLSLTGVPAVLALLPLEHGGDHSGDPLYEQRTRLSAAVGRALDAGLGAVGRLTVRRPGAVLLAWAFLSAAAVLAIPRIVIDTDFLTFFVESSPVRTDFAAVNRLLTGAVPIYVVLSGEGEGAFREPEALRAAERAQQRIERLAGVRHVLSSVDLVKVANRAMENDDPSAERIPDTRGQVAEVTFMLPKDKLRRFSTSNHSSVNLVVRTDRLGSAAVRDLEERIEAALEETKLPDGIEGRVTGNTILINRSADGIAGNQATQVGSAVLTILALICVVFRSVRIGLLSMVPNVVPVLIFFGILGAGAAPLSLPTSLIGSIALGIAIDDTVHFLVSYQRDRWEGRSSEEAALDCVQRVGRPIAMTSAMLVVGFLVMTLSGFATLREFGYLTAITMGICLTTDLLLLPSLLVKLRA